MCYNCSNYNLSCWHHRGTVTIECLNWVMCEEVASDADLIVPCVSPDHVTISCQLHHAAEGGRKYSRPTLPC